MDFRENIINLFGDHHISSIRQVFSFTSENDLDQCWNYFQDSHSESITNRNYFMSLFYEFSHQYMTASENSNFELILEQSENHVYLSIIDRHLTPSLSEFLENKMLEYHFLKETLTIRLEKEDKASAQTVETMAVAAEIENDEELSVSLSKQIKAYDFITNDDLIELLALCEDMQDIISFAKNMGCIEDLYIRFRSCFSLFLVTLGNYPELDKVYDTISSLSTLINSNQERFLTLTIDEIAFFDGFMYSLERWLKALFVEGCVSLDFMDDSLQADVETISMLIANSSSAKCTKEELDDIFDF